MAFDIKEPRDSGPPGGSIDSWLVDHEAMIDAIRSGSPALEAGLDGVLAGYAAVRSERLGGAVLDAAGRVLFANPAFETLFAGAPPAPDEAVEALRGGGHRIAFPDDDGDRPRVAVLYAPIAQARDWSLPADVRAALDRPRAAIVALAVGAIAGGEALADACRAFGLTGLQTRVAVGLVRCGEVRGAAQAAGVTYETARGVVAAVLKRTGAPRISSLIERLVRLSFGVWPEGRCGADLLTDLWHLTPRQATLALRFSEGLSRAEAAKASGMSDAVAKKHLDVIYQTTGVRTAGELARLVTETRALSLLAEATHNDIRADGEFLEPLGLIAREDGSQIAFSDHGPRTGRPVLVVHSSSASRAIPMRLVRALQAKGFRPIAIDRPGFGLTDPVADRAAYRADPFTGACPDVQAVCRHLKLDKVDVIGRGGAQTVLALFRTHPALLDRVVLVNPDPPTVVQDRRREPLAVIKEAFVSRPDLIEPLASLFIRSLGQGQFDSMLNRSIASSPPDIACMADPANRSDYARGYRLFLTGRVAGYVDEQIGMTRWTCAPEPRAAHWVVLLGAHDFLHDRAEAERFWRATLPGSRLDVVPDVGRFLVMTHPELVVDALLSAGRSVTA
jgi:pimeloyl-ACP methyl ester carboxylesterase